MWYKNLVFPKISISITKSCSFKLSEKDIKIICLREDQIGEIYESSLKGYIFNKEDHN